MPILENFEVLIERLKTQPVKKKIALIGSHEEHALLALKEAVDEGLVLPVLIGDEKATREIMRSIGFDESLAEFYDEADPAEASWLAAKLVREGKVDSLMKGKFTTAQIMKVMVNKESGFRKEGTTITLTSFYKSPGYHKIFGLTDPAIMISPNCEQKKAAIRNAVAAFHKLGVEEPKVAILAGIEEVNPKMQETLDAAEIKAEGIPGCIIEGPISFDLAMQKEASEIKGYSSPVAGDADILVCPNMACGNIMSKVMTCLSDTHYAAVVLGGLCPVLLVSRSAAARDKFLTIVVAALLGRDD